MIPTDVEIYNALRQAIYDLVVDGKSQASVAGRSYSAIDLDKLLQAEKVYKEKAEAVTNPRPAVSYYINNGDEYQ